MISTVERLFETMCLIRAFEDEAGKMLEQGFARGSVHQYVGEEAIATAICDQLHVTDYISSYHRGHGHSIAKGLDICAMAKELLGRAGGTCNGKGGSMHIADFSKGMLGANGVVPDRVTLAVGAAQSIKLLKQDRVVVAFLEMVHSIADLYLKHSIGPVFMNCPFCLFVKITNMPILNARVR